MLTLAPILVILKDKETERAEIYVFFFSLLNFTKVLAITFVPSTISS